MATYPEDPVPIYPLVLEPIFNTIISGTDGATEERLQKWTYPKYDVTVNYGKLTSTKMDLIYAFYMARKGAYGSFYIYDSTLHNEKLDHVGQYCGTGDGATEVFDIPGRSTESVSIYLDGTLQTLTTHYVLLIGGGESSADRVDFVSAPASGQIVTADFTGYLRIRARFAQDKLSREALYYQVYNFRSVQLKGLAPL